MSIETVVIGARGYTGSALLPLLQAHPEAVIKAIGSTSASGESVSDHIDGMDGTKLAFADIRPDNLADYPADLYILALPNGHAASYVSAITAVNPDAVVIDLSADYRFDPDWAYGQPERFAEEIARSKRIANPGCYATGAQLALLPLVPDLAATPVVFGVSGFSGAGKGKSRKTDPDVLRDNLLPYALTDHMHEREVTRHIAHEISFLPHVAPFFRGISLSISAELKQPANADELLRRYHQAYDQHPLIEVNDEMPEVAQARDTHRVIIGGITVSQSNPHRVSLVCVLDNLLKGAATQAIQNMNLAFGLPALAGLDPASGQPQGEADE